MHKMIHEKFESACHHLEQKLCIPSDSSQEKYDFLHIPLKDLSIQKNLLGTGGFAHVYKGIWFTYYDQVAIKVLRINDLLDNSESQIQSDFYQEISTLYKTHYEHVVTVLGACIEPIFYAIIMRYMPLSSLYDVLHKTKPDITLSWLDRYSFTWQMTKSINYSHILNPSIIHRDIKSMIFNATQCIGTT
ncbi:unnamed protein product [Rotaria socialis]|uniref:Protein kinase domain-containing protein n=2 Tax=Rotaria socialis TaxID=392032 RepID=A0A820YFF6_9BILA|nr:unnamed protein product [Rotaria socialis]